jgi:hypothetical protein
MVPFRKDSLWALSAEIPMVPESGTFRGADKTVPFHIQNHIRRFNGDRGIHSLLPFPFDVVGKIICPGFLNRKSLRWNIDYDSQGNGGNGVNSANIIMPKHNTSLSFMGFFLDYFG